MARRYRTGQSSRKRIVREIKKTGLTTLAAMFALVILALVAFKVYDYFGANDREAATDFFELGQKYMADGDYRAAKVELKKAVSADRKWPEARIAIAEVNLQLFNAFEAKNELLVAKELEVGPEKINHMLGKAHWLLGEYDQAKSILTDPKIGPEHYPDAQRVLGRVLIETGDIDGSRQAFDRAIEKAPKNSMLWTDIARFRYILGDQKAAIEAVELAVELDPKNIRALEFRGRMVRSQFGLLAALPWFERALEISPGDIPIMTEYAATLGDAGRAADMLAVTRDILELEPQNGNAYYMQAAMAARAREYGLARRLLLRAGDRQNDLPAGLLLSAIVEYELENYNLAIKLFRRLLDYQPNNKQALKLYASSLYRAGQFKQSYETISDYNRKHGPDSYSNVIAARALEAMENRKDAASYLDEIKFAQSPTISLLKENGDFEALQSVALDNPNRADLIIPYIRALLERGNTVGALNIATRLLSQNKGVADAHILVGDIQLRNNNIRAAIQHYSDAREISFEQSLMLRLIDSHRRANNYDVARETLLSYLANNPRDLMAQKLIADTYMDLGDAVQAIFWLETIKDRVGYNDTIIMTKLARSYAANDQFEKAVQSAKTAYDINPFSADTTRVYGYVLMRQGKDAQAAVELLEKAQKFLPDDPLVAKELEEARTLKNELDNQADSEDDPDE